PAPGGPFGDLDNLPAAAVESDVSGRAAEGDAKRAEAGAVKPPQGGVVRARGGGVKDATADLVEVDAESGEQVAVGPGRRAGLDLGADHGDGDAQVHRSGQGLALSEGQ